MGVFNWQVTISSLNGQQSRNIEAMVDTAAGYTVAPAHLLRELGIAPLRKGVFGMGDGRRIEMDIGEARATIDGTSVTTIVVFGDDNTSALLGAYTLEGLGLAVDPLGQRLVPRATIWY